MQTILEVKAMKSRVSSEWSLTFAPFLWLAIFFLVPTLVIYAYSFKPAELYGGIGEGWTFDTVKALFTVSNAKIIFRTLWLSITATVISLLIAIPVGYTIGRASHRFRQLLLLLVILPFWSSFIVRIFAWKSLLHPEGLFKQFLVSAHIVSPDTVLLYHPWTVVLVMVYTYVPFAILPVYTATSKFSDSLYEAAMDLGMTKLKAFFKVFLPCIRTGIWTATLLVFIPAIGAYVIPDVVGGPDSEMIGNRIVQKTFVERNIPMASALASLLSLAVLVPLAIAEIMQRRLGRDHTVKGGH